MNHLMTKTGISASKKIFLISLSACIFAIGCVQKQTPMKIVTEDPMVQNFYAYNDDNQFWFSSNKNIKTANEWLDAIELASNFGLVPDKNQIEQIREALSEKNKTDIVIKEAADQQLTGLVLNFLKELQEGIVEFDHDGVSTPRDSVYASQLLDSDNSESVSDMIARLECKDPDYVIYKKFLNDSLTANDTLKYKTILLAMNYRKYISVNGQSEYVISNIPATEVEYYRNDQSVLKMRSVAGKKRNPTPTIASYITDIVTFPFWNVPFSIASKELLPKVQADETYLERNNFEIVDAKGNIVDDYDLNWADYTEKTFPYFFRESTGPNNSLGVLKFNLKNPFSIFLHDTNSKWAFARDSRFLSHGCIRLEKPVELAELLTEGKIDASALKTGGKDTESKIIELEKKIPVFIIYMPVKIIEGRVVFLKDIYGLIK
jgi:L,D-transpeptidase YcbB